jgi:hypothetical protein
LTFRLTTRPLVTGGEMKELIATSLDYKRKIRSIKISTLSCTNPIIKEDRKFLDLLLAKGSKSEIVIYLGVDPVEIEKDCPEAAEKLKDLINIHGAKIFYNRKIHAKLLLVDGKDEKIIYLSTSNFTEMGFNNNFELGVAFFLKEESEYIVYNIYEKRFIEILKKWTLPIVYVDEENNLAWDR